MRVPTPLLILSALACAALGLDEVDDSIADPFLDGMTLGATPDIVAEHWHALDAEVTLLTTEDRTTLSIDRKDGRIVYVYSDRTLRLARLSRELPDAAAFNAAVDHWWTRLSELYGAHRHLGGLAALFWDAGPWRAALFYDLSGAEPGVVGSVTVSLELR